MREFVRGAGMLLRGFGWWRHRPGLMASGLVPAALVGLVLMAGIVVLLVNIGVITDALTPFADGWPGFWATVLRIGVGTALVGSALVVTAVTFAALTLTVGEPFYERIWRVVERDLGGAPAGGGPGFWRSVADGVSLIARGALAALVAGLASLVPVVGGLLGVVLGALLTGWLLASELASRALSARGILRDGQRALLGAHRARALGFGVATQLCFMVPLGAVATMPAAVAGATLLARSVAADARGRAAER